jgi:hypothetical protein
MNYNVHDEVGAARLRSILGSDAKCMVPLASSRRGRVVIISSVIVCPSVVAMTRRSGQTAMRYSTLLEDHEHDSIAEDRVQDSPGA